MHDDRQLVEQRLDRALARIRAAVEGPSAPLVPEAWHVPDGAPPAAEALVAPYEAFEVGGRWGRPWHTSWFRFTGTVPATWAGRRVQAVVDLGFDGQKPGFQAEGLVHDLAGNPITGVAPCHAHLDVTPSAAGEEQVGFLVEAAANPTIGPGYEPTPLGDPATAGATPLYRLARADLVVVNEEVASLLCDAEVLAGVMRELPEHDPRRHEILRALEDMLDDLDPLAVPATAAGARDALAGVLSRPATASAHRVSAVGHAHIDSAWLWPLGETVRKCVRTFATVLRLMEEYPDLVFACSQAQQYAWVKEAQPELYERIRRQVHQGRWVPVGSLWVEPDGNLPGGEALARQLVQGKRFFLEEFDLECEEVWLPDSFGYSGAFPQLAVLAGCRWFLTQKLSWNEVDRMPHHTFWWEGIDGSRVFTHFPPVDTYGATLVPSELSHAVANFADKGRATRSLVPFGHGDGGGGPPADMVERARRLRDLEGAPRVAIEAPSSFFRAAQAEYPDAPVWSGELYLEKHRGTYTSQARTKAGNRRCEHLLREAELWAATAAVYAGAEYPHGPLADAWTTVLLHQFHDILPGSSIAWVHQEAEAAHARVAEDLERLVTAAMAALGEGEGWSVANASPTSRAEVVILDPRPGEEPGGRPGQHLADGRLACRVAAPALGWAAGSGGGEDWPVRVGDDGVLDNGQLRVRVDADGLLASVVDLAVDREVLGGPAGLLQLHPDHPAAWDAWDLDDAYRHRVTDLVATDGVAVVDHGPLVGTVRVERSFSASRVVQHVRLRAGARRVELETHVEWHEQEKILKLAFPLDVHAGSYRAETQFGHVTRATHANTSWDAAQFEACAHRWVHVGEAGYGVGLANDATHGHDVRRATRPDGGTTTTVRASLLRAARYPDPRAEQGAHRFVHALLPGADLGATVAEGYALNLPLRVVPALVDRPPLVDVEDPAAVVEAVKLADDRSGDVIVRLYEARGGRVRTVLRAGFPVARAEVTDLLERPLEAAEVDQDQIRIDLRPFRILTLRLARGASSAPHHE
ncbi:MAG TPA: glycoside hydrolase family 38 C-terminal domain-containing protein [Acidimicrobiales bacterium]|nr:glycoside hydrolase family 38 C-terminal domain-containing protein [Acidimicrobiales bacterium]